MLVYIVATCLSNESVLSWVQSSMSGAPAKAFALHIVYVCPFAGPPALTVYTSFVKATDEQADHAAVDLGFRYWVMAT